LPVTEEEWRDVVKIANGRWPSERSEKAENEAKESFKEVYKREVDMKDPHDNAAVTIMAYGLRPADRNMDSEARAIQIFANIYGDLPETVDEWDIVRAIAYSGASR
jgi:hypothetical protein